MVRKITVDMLDKFNRGHTVAAIEMLREVLAIAAPTEVYELHPLEVYQISSARREIQRIEERIRKIESFGPYPEPEADGIPAPASE